MNRPNIEYRVKTVSEIELYIHLANCAENFIPPLTETVNIKEYSKKLLDKAIIFEAWVENILVGCIAAYFNDETNHSGYITNVSVLKEFMGFGIASELLTMCKKYAQKNKVLEISLEVNSQNYSAINLYEKNKFIQIEKINDTIIMDLVF